MGRTTGGQWLLRMIPVLLLVGLAGFVAGVLLAAMIGGGL